MTEKRKLPQAVLLACYMGMTAVLFLACPKITPGKLTLAFLAVFSVIVILWLFKTLPKASVILSKGKTLASVVMISVFGSFASFGYRLFSMDDVRMHAKTSDVLFLLLGIVWFVPVILSLYTMLESAVCLPRHPRTLDASFRHKRLKTQLLLLLLLCLVQCVFLFSFWPGGFGMDTVYEMQQVAGDVPLSDSHPAFWALSMRLFWSMFKNPAVFTIIQLFAFAWIVSEFLMIAWDQGFSAILLAGMGVLFIIMPNQAMSGISVVKDYPFLLALLWGTLLLYRFVIHPDECTGVGFALQILLSMFFMMGFRHNGICPALAEGICFIVLALKKASKRTLLIAAPVSALILFALMKGPVYSALQVQPNTQTAYTPALCAVGAVVSKDLPLSDETNHILEKVMPLNDWKNYYSRFEGHDRYMWGRGADQTFDAGRLSIFEVARVYSEALLKYPDVVLLDRLNGIDILWNIKQPLESFNIRYNDVIYLADFTTDYFDVTGLENTGVSWYGYVNHAGISDLYRLTGTVVSAVTDLLFWRGGAYLILLFVAVLFARVHRLKAVRIAAVPFWANLILSALGVYQQSFRYIYFVQVLTIAICFLAVASTPVKQQNND